MTFSASTRSEYSRQCEIALTQQLSTLSACNTVIVLIRYIFTFAVYRHRRPSVYLSSVTFVHPTQQVAIFGNVSMPFGTLAISSQGNTSVGELNARGV